PRQAQDARVGHVGNAKGSSRRAFLSERSRIEILEIEMKAGWRPKGATPLCSSTRRTGRKNDEKGTAGHGDERRTLSRRGGLPLANEHIITNVEGESLEWRKGKEFAAQEEYR